MENKSMEFENEKKNEEMSAEQQSTNNSQDGGYQGYRPGRSPRPRIHQTVRPYNQGGYHQNQNQEEGGFRPEGFGAGLQGGTPQRAYRPRNNYNQEGGYQPRQQGYRPRPQYGQQDLSTDSRRVAISLVSKRVAISLVSKRVAISLVSKATVPVRNMDSRKVVISLVEAIPMVTHIRRSNMVRTIPMPSTQ